jgi:N-6 DNA Methylase
VCGAHNLSSALREQSRANRLFDWLAESFNGDMFPQTAARDFEVAHLSRVADFLDATDADGQQSFFPYQFNVIPVELISSIYEQFAHSKTVSDTEQQNGEETPDEAKKRGVHYTRLPVVSLILDEVMDNISGDETVLDLTCGSGVFLVEALRRLVAKKGGSAPTRELIRKTLYSQVYGVDLSEAAVRVAAFSLYLAALELDPNPQPPEALKFEKLIGRSLLIGDARSIEKTPDGHALLTDEGGCRKFDIVVGNPPWTFRGKDGTEQRRNTMNVSTPKMPRGEGLDFVLRATEFSHSKTRFGLALSAMPFFAGSKTGGTAVRYVVEQLSPVTLVNLSAHRDWLYPTAGMPSAILLARHREQRVTAVTLVNVEWSPSGKKSHTFEVAPGDIKSLSLSDWAADPGSLKTAMFGKARDRALMRRTSQQYQSLKQWLASVGSDWRDGLILGNPKNRDKSASHLLGLPLIGAKNLKAFRIPSDLPLFAEPMAQWPRAREIYKHPILLIKEGYDGGPRPISAVSETDIVYTDGFFGAALRNEHTAAAWLISGILSSSFAAWYLLMRASEFGIFKNRLFTTDVDGLPIPDPIVALKSKAGAKVIEVAKQISSSDDNETGFESLDAAVAELYEFDEDERAVVADGLVRAGWQWKKEREESACVASNAELISYAETFAQGIDNWLVALNKRYIEAEVFELPELSPLRVIRFTLGQGRKATSVKTIAPQGTLSSVIDAIGKRVGVRLGSALVGQRELRVHGRDEVIIIKPAARRFWMKSIALEDSDAVIAESFSGGNA